MAKQENTPNEKAKKSSELFHNIMKASVNNKSKPDLAVLLKPVIEKYPDYFGSADFIRDFGFKQEESNIIQSATILFESPMSLGAGKSMPVYNVNQKLPIHIQEDVNRVLLGFNKEYKIWLNAY